ncbi:CDT1-like protein a, chloroplastic [Phragmites australis]|uniref:CDT1-like protein a, chloroplastic n=1 Tax=Phragmites australis TaxID=29695 RepID=UPI002D76CF13|nr:CDT1-like protein a, chloroplastic [Phragmites australis]
MRMTQMMKTIMTVSPGDSQSLISGRGSIKLLERHKNLLNLFNKMESSIRLLRLRKKMTTFKNIATQVEVLTKRKFSHSPLAQMKYLFPEAIQINRILLHDEKSLCMYADMEITLVMNVVECGRPDQSPSMAICEAFYSKLLNFLDAHHKENDPMCIIGKEKINQVDPLDTQEKLGSLRVTFDIVCDISRSTKNSLMTKQELFHNILANNLEIEEIGEIEEQLHIVEDLAPD